MLKLNLLERTLQMSLKNHKHMKSKNKINRYFCVFNAIYKENNKVKIKTI